MQLHLNNDKLNKNTWQQSGNLFLTGFVFENGSKATLEGLERSFENCDSLIETLDLLNRLDGNFALIYKTEEQIIAAVDLCRSIPLAFNNDSIYTLGANFSNNLDVDTTASMANLEFLQGDKTFDKERKQLQAGEILIIDDQWGARVKKYAEHFRVETPIAVETAKAEFSRIIEKMGEQLLAQLEGRNALVPLSGGYDSRFILALLKNGGYENITAFTYGQAESYEAKTAKKVCDQLGVEWRFIEYSKSLFEESDLAEFNSYCEYASVFGSVPQEQEFFALKSLANELNPADYMILPGFCGDVQAGSFIPDKFYESKWYKSKVSPREYLAEKYCEKQRIEASNEKFEDFWEFYSHIEQWVLCERESKYIINGVRAYEFFGFEWYLPLWQKDFIKFWQMVPSTYRRDRALYIEVLNEKLFEPLGINFRSGGFDSRFKSGGVNTYLRHVLPKGLKSGLKKLLIPKNEIEINNLNYFAQRLGREMGAALDHETLVVNEVMGEYLGFLFRKAQQSS